MLLHFVCGLHNGKTSATANHVPMHQHSKSLPCLYLGVHDMPGNMSKLLCNIAAIGLQYTYCSSTNIAHLVYAGGQLCTAWPWRLDAAMACNSHEAAGMADFQLGHTLASFHEVLYTDQLFAWLIFVPASIATLWSILA